MSKHSQKQKQGPAHWARVREVHMMLRERYPGLFESDKPVPLQIGIYHELRRTFPEIPGRIVHGVLHWLTMRRAYLIALQPGAQRFGLGGPTNEYVTTKQAFDAEQRFKQRDANAKDKWNDRANHLQQADGASAVGGPKGADAAHTDEDVGAA